MSRLLAAQRALTVPGWAKDELSRKAQAIPSLDLRFAEGKSLVDATTGANLVTFTRASSGTFTGSDGVLRTATTNLLLRSEEFDNASWNKAASSISPANAISAPNGTVSADKLVEDSTLANHYAWQLINVTAGVSYTLSIYAKAAERSEVFLALSSFNSAFLAETSCYFNLAAGTIRGKGVNATAQIIAVGDGWYRCSITGAAQTTTSAIINAASVSNGVTFFYTGDGTSGIYLWGAQIEQSATAGEYIPTTSTINSAPRFDHNPTTGESLGLLVEEARTNSIRNNTMVGAVAGTPGTLPTNWSLLGGTGLTTQVVGTGTENGVAYLDFRFSGTTGNTFTGLQFDGSISGLTTATAYTGSVYLKRTAGSLANLTQPTIYIRYNLSPSGQSDISATVSSLAAPSANLVQSRYSVTGTTAGTLSGIGAIFVLFNHSSGVAVDLTLRIGLPQLEQGAFATSPILTSTAAATRSADVASITGSAFSSWYRQDEGTVFAEYLLPNLLAGTVASFDDGTANNRWQMRYTTAPDAGRYRFVSASGSFDYTSQTVLPIANRMSKSAYVARSTDQQWATNAVISSIAGSQATMPTVDRLQIGNGAASDQAKQLTIRRLTYWPARLSNASLQTLTQ